MTLITGAIVGGILWALSEAVGPKVTLIFCLIGIALCGWFIFWYLDLVGFKLMCNITHNWYLFSDKFPLEVCRGI